MGFRAVDHSVNIIGIRKNDVNYAMCCAWAMMVDYDKLMCLLGSQSDTGNNICKGDIIGFTSLNKNQIDVAYKLGDNHSSEVNKLDGVDYELNGSAILINGGKTVLVCEVVDILKLEGIEEDNCIYLKIIEKKENEGDFLHMSDLC